MVEIWSVLTLFSLGCFLILGDLKVWEVYFFFSLFRCQLCQKR